MGATVGWLDDDNEGTALGGIVGINLSAVGVADGNSEGGVLGGIVIVAKVFAVG